MKVVEMAKYVPALQKRQSRLLPKFAKIILLTKIYLDVHENYQLYIR